MNGMTPEYLRQLRNEIAWKDLFERLNWVHKNRVSSSSLKIYSAPVEATTISAGEIIIPA